VDIAARRRRTVMITIVGAASFMDQDKNNN